MSVQSNMLRRIITLEHFTIIIVIILVLAFILGFGYIMQTWAEQFSLLQVAEPPATKEQFEIAKLSAEIQQIRSDTLGSLFWLKLIALIITVGGAVAGYLLGLSRTTQQRLEFENRKNVDAVYQSMVQELSDKSPLLRAAAAVKLGMMLKSFPVEWSVDGSRKAQLIQLTKQVLAASLAIEEDEKVRKTLTIALVLHKPWEGDEENPKKKKHADAREIDLSNAKAADAYWAKTDFSYTDFYKADLTRASFRNSILHSAQFREATLREAVLAGADCLKASFKLADLRGADLTGADLRGADFSDADLSEVNFDGAKVSGCVMAPAKLDVVKSGRVDISKDGDGSQVVSVQEWASALAV